MPSKAACTVRRRIIKLSIVLFARIRALTNKIRRVGSGSRIPRRCRLSSLARSFFAFVTPTASVAPLFLPCHRLTQVSVFGEGRATSSQADLFRTHDEAGVAMHYPRLTCVRGAGVSVPGCALGGPKSGCIIRVPPAVRHTHFHHLHMYTYVIRSEQKMTVL